MPTIEQLTAMKNKIDAAKVEAAKLEGSLANHMKRLKELGFESTEEADKELEKLQEKIAAFDEQVKHGIEELQREYGL